MKTEQKINAIMRYIVSETREEKNLAIAEIRKIMRETESAEEQVDTISVIEDVLTEIGVPCHIIGYRYLLCAIDLVVENFENIKKVVDVVYATVAAKHNVTKTKVERGIRYAIECAWDRTDIDSVVVKYFGNSVSFERGKPTNSEFIARVAKIVKRRTDTE